MRRLVFAARRWFRSGELLPCGMFDRGTREGILEGEVLVGDFRGTRDVDVASGLRFMVSPRVGVLVIGRGGGGPRIELPGRLGAAGFKGTKVDLEVGAGPDGVFERG
jgi:hypothetical protein